MHNAAWTYVFTLGGPQACVAGLLSLMIGLMLGKKSPAPAVYFSFLSADSSPLNRELQWIALFCYGCVTISVAMILHRLSADAYRALGGGAVAALALTGLLIGMLVRRNQYGRVLAVLIGTTLPLCVITLKLIAQSKMDAGNGALVLGMLLSTGLLSCVSVERYARETTPYGTVLIMALAWLVPFVFLM